jgi:hypothetical protein
VQAYIREWPYPEFIAEVKAAFPDKAIATVEEARVWTMFVSISSCSVDGTVNLGGSSASTK